MANKSGAIAEGASQGLAGRAVEDLTVSERLQYAGRWVAFQIYTPPQKVTRDGAEYVDVRLRRIAAVGSSAGDCIAQLRRRNLDPAEFEFTPLKPPY